MFNQQVGNLALLVPLAVVIFYYDVRYRRIPNVYVAAALLGGLLVNTALAGWNGTLASLKGCLFAFGLMLILHIFGALGAGDVKLFAAIGAVIGVGMVPTTFVVVVLTGGLLALGSTLLAGTLRETVRRVGAIFYSLLFSLSLPRYEVPADRRLTIPYGVAITGGSLISLAFF